MSAAGPVIEVRLDHGEGPDSQLLRLLKARLGSTHPGASWRFTRHPRSARTPPAASTWAALALAASERALARCAELPPSPPGPTRLADQLGERSSGAAADVAVVVCPRGGMGDPEQLQARLGVVMLCWPEALSTATVGLREVLAKEDTAAFVLSVFAPGGTLVYQRRVALATRLLFSWTHDLLLNKAAALVACSITRLLNGTAWPLQARPPLNAFDEPSLRQPRPQPWRDLLGYGARLPTRLMVKAGRIATGTAGRTWHIALSRGGWQEHLAGARTVIDNPPGRFWADPFVWHHEGRDVIFLEEFDLQTQRAHLAVLEIGEQGQLHPLGECLREDFHLSFPFVFTFEGQLYMCPEVSAARQIRVYRCDEFPLRWSLAQVLMEGVSAADTLLLPHEGRWWMFTNIDSSGGQEHNTELHLFWADSPLSTYWTPHPVNPVITDAGHARNGGLVRPAEGEIYRVSQTQRFGVYGAGLSVNAVRELAPLAYREQALASFQPPPHDGCGAHHLSSNGRWTVSDHLR